MRGGLSDKNFRNRQKKRGAINSKTVSFIFLQILYYYGKGTDLLCRCERLAPINDGEGGTTCHLVDNDNTSNNIGRDPNVGTGESATPELRRFAASDMAATPTIAIDRVGELGERPRERSAVSRRSEVGPAGCDQRDEQPCATRRESGKILFFLFLLSYLYPLFIAQ